MNVSPLVRLALAGLAALTLTVSVAASATPDPYVFNVILNGTGANGWAGQTETAALKVFEQYENKHGGLWGRPIHFDVYDDQTEPRVAVQLVNQILAKNPKPLVVFGSGQVATCAAIAPLFDNGPVNYCYTPGYSPKQPGGYVFSASASLEKILPAQVRFARGSNWKRVANVSVTTATGQAADYYLRYSLSLPENRNMQLVFNEAFNPADITVSALVTRLKAADPQVIITPASGAAFGTLLRALNDAGMHVPVLTSAANEQPDLMHQFAGFLPAQTYFNGMLYYARDAIGQGPLRTEIDNFYAAYKAAGASPTPDSGQAWDPALIVLTGLRKLGPSATAAQLRDYIANLHGFAGSSGFYDFRSNDGHGLASDAVIFVRWDAKKGDFVNASRRGGAPL
ncbi:MAG TPA: ABC transporter substrate-binding protein [Candidatus Lustribacter sp.]|nr:ABC transporter substrate-binding protein [Candidatus Lustribacter sp.]